MAYSYVWPVGLPQKPQEDFTESGGNFTILRTSPELGPAKQRRRGLSPRVMSLSFIMTNAELDTLKTFVMQTIKGVSRFGFTHPITNNTEEVRFIPQGEGELYSVSYITVNRWKVSMKFEVMP